jgi:uncharacterized protein YegL
MEIDNTLVKVTRQLNQRKKWKSVIGEIFDYFQAVEVLIEIIKNMKQEERIGIILFDHEVTIFEPIKKVSKLNMEELISRVSKIVESGSTDMELGMRSAVRMMNDLFEEDPESNSYQNRIIFLTDANPNVGGGENSLTGISEKASQKDIFTTFIGIGLDFNTEIVANISKVRGGIGQLKFNYLQRKLLFCAFKRTIPKDFSGGFQLYCFTNCL